MEERGGPGIVLLSSTRAVVMYRRIYNLGCNNVESIERGREFVNSDQIKTGEETDAVHGGVEVFQEHGAIGRENIRDHAKDCCPSLLVSRERETVRDQIIVADRLPLDYIGYMERCVKSSCLHDLPRRLDGVRRYVNSGHSPSPLTESDDQSTCPATYVESPTRSQAVDDIQKSKVWRAIVSFIPCVGLVPIERISVLHAFTHLDSLATPNAR